MRSKRVAAMIRSHIPLASLTLLIIVAVVVKRNEAVVQSLHK